MQFVMFEQGYVQYNGPKKKRDRFSIFSVTVITTLHILPVCVAPVVTGVGPSFSMGELQGHLAYDLNQSVNQPVSLRRSLASTSSSG